MFWHRFDYATESGSKFSTACFMRTVLDQSSTVRSFVAKCIFGVQAVFQSVSGTPVLINCSKSEISERETTVVSL